MCGGVLICTEISTVSDTTYFAESRRDQEEGGELDSKKLAQKRSRAGRWCWARERERAGLLLLHLFPNGGATDVVTVLHSGWDSNCVVWWSLRNAGQILP